MQIIESAGGVIINSFGQVVMVKQDTSRVPWSLPKGHIDPGEEPLAVALREIYEETGLRDLTFVKALPVYDRELFKENGEKADKVKRFYYFLFTSRTTTLTPQDPDNPEARWVQKTEVEHLLTHEKDKEFFLSLLAEGVI